MVGEFPELQGVMGGYYAAAQGEPRGVADAVRDHYKPVGQGDEVPTAPVTVAVSLADKLDTLFSFFREGMLPTGSKDPFALRRAALGVLQLIEKNGLRFRIDWAAKRWNVVPQTSFALVLTDFLQDRLGVRLREQGIRYDFVQASCAWGTGLDDRLDRVQARARALHSLVLTDDGANLLAGYKRAANILKKEGYAPAAAVTPAEAGVSGDGAVQEPRDAPASAGATESATVLSSATPAALHEAPASAGATEEREPAEAALSAALDVAEPAAADAVAREDFAAAMAALATLRAPIDAFFDTVIVNDADPAKRSARLALLARVRSAVHGVADFSKVEG